MAFTDLVGQWQYLGVLTPTFETWQRFPTPTDSNYSVLRLTYYGRFNRIVSIGHLRAIYRTPELSPGKWARIYPKEEKEIITLEAPKELLFIGETVNRAFEVKKRPKNYRWGTGIVDEPWSVGIEILEVLNLSTDQQIMLEQTEQIELATQIIQNLLRGGS